MAYKIIVDTDKYAGNFERELCAYVTGIYERDTGVGQEISEEEEENIEHFQWWEDNVSYFYNEHGSQTCVEIEPTPGYFNNGTGGVYKDEPENYEKAKTERNQSTQKYYQAQIDRYEAILKNPNLSSKEINDAKKQIKIYEREIVEKNAQELVKYPAYYSVAIHCENEPPKEVLEEFKKRAVEFFTNHEPGVKITGFRKIQEIKNEIEMKF